MLDALGQQVDVYRLKIGIRTVKWNTNTFFINDRPFYFRGFGRHEDFNVRHVLILLVLQLIL